jgi:hypothetical protein
MPTCGECTFSVSTEHEHKTLRQFYANYSKQHPPKNRIGLVAREEQFMQDMRLERNTKGFSEGFATRRRFPITTLEPDSPKHGVSSPAPSFRLKPMRSAEDIWREGAPWSPQV